MSSKSRYFLAFALAAVLIAGIGCGSSASAKLQRAVNSDWLAYKAQHNVPTGGMAVYVVTPAGSYFADSGMAPVDQNTHFRIASNTKSFTAAAIMLLNQQGKLRIDDSIVSTIPGKSVPYVPDGPQYNIPYKSTITIRQLMNHTAGVYDVTNDPMPSNCPADYAGKYYLIWIQAEKPAPEPNHQFSLEELIGVAATCQASYSAPLVQYKYSNTGYSLLAVIIQQVSGLPYDQFIQQNLIAPNHLSATSVVMLASDQKIPPPFAEGYIYTQGALHKVTESNMSGNVAEGNIISTPADLAQWVRRLIRGQAGPNAASVQAMETLSPQSGGKYGLGIFYAPGLGYGHNGAQEGYLSQMTYDPDSDVTVIIFFNIWDYDNLNGQMSMMGASGQRRQAGRGLLIG